MLPGEVVPWYLVPDYVLYSLLAAVGVSVVARAAPYRLPSPGLAVIPVLVLVLIAGSFNIRRDAELVKNTNIILRDAGLWARENLPPDSTAAMYDSGYFSYFSEIDTVSLNGLVTDFDTMTQLVDGDRSGVIQRLGVEYLVLLVQEDVENVIPGNKVVYTSRVFPSGSSSPGAKLFIIGPLDDETIRLLD